MQNIWFDKIDIMSVLKISPLILAIRVLSPAELAESQIWWHGPHWLRLYNYQWPIQNSILPDTDVELRTVKSHVTFFTNYHDILKRLSSFDRALRVVAYIFRFFYRIYPSYRGRSTYQNVSLTSSELKTVRLRLAVQAQKAHYAAEYNYLLIKMPLDSKRSLLR